MESILYIFITVKYIQNYRNAKKRCRRLGLDFPIKEEELNKNPVEFIKNILLMNKEHINFKEIGISEWKRPILYFYKQIFKNVCLYFYC